METIKYSNKQFEGYTHRFVLTVKVENSNPSLRRIAIYSNSDSYRELEDFINKNKSTKVTAFVIEYRCSKEDDELDAEFVNEILK